MGEFNYFPRKEYQKKLSQSMRRCDLIFILGARITGKTSFAAYAKGLIKRYANEGDNVRGINFERLNKERFTIEELVESFYSSYEPEVNNIFLIDEISHVIDWEIGVNEVLKLKNVKAIFLSSSRNVVSEKLEAVREGRYEVIEMLPLSLPEFIAFHKFSEVNPTDPVLPQKAYRDADNAIWTLDEIYERYVLSGGLPVYERGSLSPQRCISVADGTYCSIVTHDILEVGSRSSRSSITDPLLLRCIITVMAKNIGSNISATWVGKQTERYLRRASSTKTIESYMNAALNANLFYVSGRLDIPSGLKLKTLPKYYMVDTSLHNFVAGMMPSEPARLLENQVYLELKRMGCNIYNGKMGSAQVTFVAENGHNRLYAQVVDRLNEGNMRAVLQPLRKIKDNFPKIVVCRECVSRKTTDGILITNALEFLMGLSAYGLEK